MPDENKEQPIKIEIPEEEDFETIEVPVVGTVNVESGDDKKEGRYINIDVGNTGLHIRRYDNGRGVLNFQPEGSAAHHPLRTAKYTYLFAYGMYELYQWAQTHPEIATGQASNNTNEPMANLMTKITSQYGHPEIFVLTQPSGRKLVRASLDLDALRTLPAQDPFIQRLKLLHGRAQDYTVGEHVPITRATPNP